MRCHMSQVGTMSSTASCFETAGMVEREAVPDTAAAIMAGETKPGEAERIHDLDHAGRHGALGIGRVLFVRLAAPPTSRNRADPPSPK